MALWKLNWLMFSHLLLSSNKQIFDYQTKGTIFTMTTTKLMSAQHLSQSVNTVAFLFSKPLFFVLLFSNSFVFIKSFSISTKVQSDPKYLTPSSHVYKHG